MPTAPMPRVNRGRSNIVLSIIAPSPIPSLSVSSHHCTSWAQQACFTFCGLEQSSCVRTGAGFCEAISSGMRSALYPLPYVPAPDHEVLNPGRLVSRAFSPSLILLATILLSIMSGFYRGAEPGQADIIRYRRGVVPVCHDSDAVPAVNLSAFIDSRDSAPAKLTAIVGEMCRLYRTREREAHKRLRFFKR